jgi:hypothetical protein
MKRNDEYPYVDGVVKRLELTEDVDSEGSPSPSASSDEDEEEIMLDHLGEDEEVMVGPFISELLSLSPYCTW